MDANRRGVAFRATTETRLETTAQGEAFLATCRAAWPNPFLDRWTERLSESGGVVCYAAAVGAVTAQADIPLDCALLGYLQALASNLVSAGLRLGIIGQTDGQRILAALEAKRLTLGSEADRPTLIRRVCFDLTGLPPTVAELDAFLPDNAPDAYDKMLETIRRQIKQRQLTILVTHWWEYFREQKANEAFIGVLHETADYLANEPSDR